MLAAGSSGVIVRFIVAKVLGIFFTILKVSAYHFTAPSGASTKLGETYSNVHTSRSGNTVTGIFRVNSGIIITADALAPCVTFW